MRQVYDRLGKYVGSGTYALTIGITLDWQGWAESLKHTAHTVDSSYKEFSGAVWHGNNPVVIKSTPDSIVPIMAISQAWQMRKGI